MNVLFDQNLPRYLPRTLSGFLMGTKHEACALSDRFAPQTPDEMWIAGLGGTPGEWIVFSADMRITKDPVQRAAWRAAGLKGFFLASGWQKMPPHERAARIVWHWPKVLDHALAVRGALAMELRVGWGSVFRRLSL